MVRSLPRRTFLGLLAGSLLSTRATADADDPPAGYTNVPFAHGGLTLDVWTAGDKGHPLVFVLHDMAGLRRECFDLGDALVDKQFFVAIPRFFGGFGGAGLGYLKACEFRSKFRCYDLDDYGPVMPWIKGLARHGSGSGTFGVIGNCMTGVLPLLMLRSSRCAAPVLCQPAYPFNSFFAGKAYRSALGLPQIDLDFAALRTSRDQIPVLGMRFKGDGLCPPERFRTLRCLLGDQFHCLELDGDDHSTLIGKHRSPAALETAIAFLNHRLKRESWTPPAACQAARCTP